MAPLITSVIAHMRDKLKKYKAERAAEQIKLDAIAVKIRKQRRKISRIKRKLQKTDRRLRKQRRLQAGL